MAAANFREAIRDVDAAVVTLRCLVPASDPVWDDFYVLLIDLGRMLRAVGDVLDALPAGSLGAGW
jgi:hypothetical protein